MLIRKYTVKSISEAMEKIRHEFGEDAYILDTKKIKKGGFFGIGGEKYLEVTVLSEIDEKDKKEPQKSKNKDIQKQNYNTYSLNEIINRNMENEKRNNKQNVNYFASQEERLTSKDLNEELINLIERNREISSKIDKDAQDFYNKRDLIAKEKQKVNSNDHLVESVKFEELKKMVESLNKKIDSTNLFLQELKEILYQKSYSKDFINNFILEISNLNIKENWKSDDVLKIKFEKKLSNVLQTINFNNIKGKVIFIGPTGVGKTTTLAKIAAIMKKEQLKIAFVTIDTYRIAATDQLRTYADILDIPLKICYNPQDLKTTVDSLLNYDVILIDTAGRSPKNNLQMGELKVFIDAIKPDYKILLISSNVNCEDMIKTYDSFSFLEPNCLIFTKLDETSSFGQLFSFLEHSKLPLLGITNGQRVPEDLKFPGKEQLVNVALKEVFK